MIQNNNASSKCLQLLFDIDPLGYQHSVRQIHIECRYRIVHKFLETKVGRLASRVGKNIPIIVFVEY
jgi:hypothetical protein